MSNKSVLYIVLAFILIFALGVARDIAIEFIKATKEDANPTMMNPMMPFFFGNPREHQNSDTPPPLNGRNMAVK